MTEEAAAPSGDVLEDHEDKPGLLNSWLKRFKPELKPSDEERSSN